MCVEYGRCGSCPRHPAHPGNRRQRTFPSTHTTGAASFDGLSGAVSVACGKPGAHDPLFLSEQRARLTPNVFTLLFQRLCTRAGLEDRHLTPTMLREMVAIRFLQTGGPPKALQRLLGLAESTPIKRYQDAAGPSRLQREISLKQRKE